MIIFYTHWVWRAVLTVNCSGLFFFILSNVIEDIVAVVGFQVGFSKLAFLSNWYNNTADKISILWFFNFWKKFDQSYLYNQISTLLLAAGTSLKIFICIRHMLDLLLRYTVLLYRCTIMVMLFDNISKNCLLPEKEY